MRVQHMARISQRRHCQLVLSDAVVKYISDTELCWTIISRSKPFESCGS